MSSEREPGPAPASRDSEQVDSAPFGAQFFLTVLRAFVRDRCPDPGEGLPAVQLRLADGEQLDVCHVMGIAPSWIALAVNEGERATTAPPMRTEVVPYSLILRVTIRTVRPGMHHVGFDVGHEPNLFERLAGSARTPEEALRATAGQPFKDRRPAATAGPGRTPRRFREAGGKEA